jgi:prevent-host-death family protein
LSDAKARFSELLDDVERGETLVITRHGRAIARLVPESDERHAEALRSMERIEAFRQTMPRLSLGEILSARHDGHKY